MRGDSDVGTRVSLTGKTVSQLWMEYDHYLGGIWA